MGMHEGVWRCGYGSDRKGCDGKDTGTFGARLKVGYTWCRV